VENILFHDILILGKNQSQGRMFFCKHLESLIKAVASHSTSLNNLNIETSSFNIPKLILF
jgi:hypothetical protein